MKSTTQGYKDILASGQARKYVIKIDLTLADNTVLHLTEADIWEDSFGIETASSGTSTFDLGCAVIGKCKFTINNIDGDFDNYDFFNASAVVWLGLVGDTVNDQQQYYRMGFYTVDEPTKANGLISLELLDNMWKFDVPFSSVNITYPATIRTIIQAICSYCGVSLAGTSQTFNGYNFTISEAPDVKDDMNCREVLQYLAMIGCNFCLIDSTGYLVLKWYDASTTNVFEWNASTSFGTEDIEITGVKFVIDDTEYKLGTNGYVLELENPFVNASNVSSVLNLIWKTGYLQNFTLRIFNMTTASDLAAEIGDKVKVMDYKGNYVYSWITLNSFKLASHIIQCNAQSPQRTLVKRYSKEVRAAVEVARQAADEVISNYDLAVQMMNSLAVNAMGGYEDYEDAPTGGRIWYLSNMPITKNPTTGVCSFETGSTVYKKSGDGFFVSRDGGITWVNGYNMSTGELVVNVLDAIGINFDWARGGTLTLGGYGNGNGVCEVKDASNQTIVRINNDGITMYKGVIQSPDYSEASAASTYATTGMKIDVINKLLKTPYFTINQSGAYFNGTIEIRGDIDLNTSKLRPTDYYLASDFRIQFQASEGYVGTSTAEIILHYFTESGGVWTEDTTTIDSITLTDDTPELSSLLDHTVGQNGKDYYEINTSSSLSSIIKDAILAKVDSEGFHGRLEGIFEGFMKSDSGKIAGFGYGSGTSGSYVGWSPQGLFRDDSGNEFSMVDGFKRANGALVRLYDNVINFGNKDSTSGDARFDFFIADRNGDGANLKHLDIVIPANENPRLTRYDSSGNVIDNAFFGTYGTQDITAGTSPLETGTLYLVYE